LSVAALGLGLGLGHSGQLQRLVLCFFLPTASAGHRPLPFFRQVFGADPRASWSASSTGPRHARQACCGLPLHSPRRRPVGHTSEDTPRANGLFERAPFTHTSPSRTGAHRPVPGTRRAPLPLPAVHRVRTAHGHASWCRVTDPRHWGPHGGRGRRADSHPPLVVSIVDANRLLYPSGLTRSGHGHSTRVAVVHSFERQVDARGEPWSLGKSSRHVLVRRAA